MRMISRAVTLMTCTSGAAIGTFFVSTRHATMEQLPITDPLFRSSFYHRYNPHSNPTIRDNCTRCVPLSKVKVLLLEEGRLVEAFSAGFWSGPGYWIQRLLLSHKYECAATAHQLWSRHELRQSNYDVGIQVTNHFEVLEKTQEHIIFRGGDSPSRSGLRPLDGLLQLTAIIREDRDVVEFSIKSLFYQGSERSTSPPMSFVEEWLHRQYVKLLMETGIRSITR
ncbi:hypothetical protein OIDMADRAFT_136393 [Oidiodendron maius Zn]|uniref:Uncharacterized protein n=1 Tax=Oidiodendron maius (strain Zn) TaxID=913774 RepID=A0A0C3GD88_OIDMZ|nr:hypothetical protein OIDMADRAFT_136393 [Oidiodendron maius Zn]